MTAETPQHFRALLQTACSQGEAHLGDDQQEMLAAYLASLSRWNQAFNLTSVTEPAAMVAVHMSDSLSARDFLLGEKILDVGTGAGLPGIPLAVAEPERQFTLLDAAGKKTRFVTQVAAELGLNNIEVVQARAEDYAPDSGFDTVISRAFAELSVFIARCGALPAADGRLVAMKGRYPADELAAMPDQWLAEKVAPVRVAGLDAERHIIVLKRRA